MANQSQPQPQPQPPPTIPPGVVPTELGKKYGVSHQNFLLKEGKSGLTPEIPLPSPSLKRLTLAEQRDCDLLHAYQLFAFHGFAARELHDLGCIDVADALPAQVNLGVPVHDVYQKDKWLEHINDPLVGNGIPGKWNAKNPIIWSALQPSLRLATQFLANKSLSPWFDALVSGARKPLPANPDYAQQYTFHRREIQKIIEEMESYPSIYRGIDYLTSSPLVTRNIRFRFFAEENGPSGVTRAMQYVNGPNRISRCQIHTRLIGPLLCKDLTASERLVQQFSAAKTILHETSHALQYLAHEQKFGLNTINEAFFEDEKISEVGYSMENALFGGMVHRVIRSERVSIAATPSGSNWGHPIMGLRMDTYPNFKRAEHYRMQRRIWSKKKAKAGMPPSMKTNLYNEHDFQEEDLPRGILMSYTTWPIPIRWMEKFQHQEFWTNATKLGDSAVKVPRTLGLKRGRFGDMEMVVGQLYNEYGGISPTGIFGDEPWDTMTIQARLNDEDTLKRYAIRSALRNRADWKQIQNWEANPRGFAVLPAPDGNVIDSNLPSLFRPPVVHPGTGFENSGPVGAGGSIDGSKRPREDEDDNPGSNKKQNTGF